MIETRFIPKWRLFRVLNLKTGEWLQIEGPTVEFAVIAAAQQHGQGEADLHVGRLTYSVGDFCGQREN